MPRVVCSICDNRICACYPRFTAAELSTIRCGMESAVITYAECAGKCALNPRLVAQFTAQAADAQAIVDKLSEAGY